jgi:hypothetical protein
MTKRLAFALVLCVGVAFGIAIRWTKELATAAFAHHDRNVAIAPEATAQREQNMAAPVPANDREGNAERFKNEAGKAWLDIESEEKVLRRDGEEEHVPAGRPAMQITDVSDEEFPTSTVTGRALTITIVPDKEARLSGESVLIRAVLCDKVAGRGIVLTDAKMSCEWLTPHRHWADGEPKKLRLYYLPDVNRRTPERNYFGYLISVYYRGQLQTARWQPDEVKTAFQTPQRLQQPTAQSYAWKTNITTTVFWIGLDNNSNSAWDQEWQVNYGGFDNPDQSARRNYIPVAFIPKQNPFYCALPYNDVMHGQFKPEAPLVIPWFKQSYMGQGQSVCWHRWVAIRKGNRTCYAQWEDCGPFRQDYFQYVFGNERPKPNLNNGAGLSVSPAVRDYLELEPSDVTDWQFVDTQDVPPGPWRSYGENNPFVVVQRQAGQHLVQQGGSPRPSATPTPNK